MGWETFQFGRLYLDGKPRDIPTIPTRTGDIPDYGEGQEIDIMEGTLNHSITWIKPDSMNLFVADRVLLNSISWDDLNNAGFVEGKIVNIGGRRYRCRLLQAGDSKYATNEWDSVLNATTEDDGLWHWKSILFWGVDTIPDWVAYRSVRGHKSARYWYFGSTHSRDNYLGFRPALEPLPSDVLETDELTILEGQKFVVSQLQDTTGRMFYPSLTAIEARPFADIPDGTTIKMYTALANGNPVRTDLDKPELMPQGAQITLTDKFYGQAFLIPWVVSNGVAIASRPILKSYS